MILRILVNAPLTTKGTELTWEELDGNLIKIFQDLSTKVKAGSIADFDSATVYSLGDGANYNDLTWLYLNAAPAAGIDPGSDPLYWAEVDPTFFIHEKDKDTMLAKGTADEVTAADLAALVAAGDPNTIFTGGSQTSDSLIDQEGYSIFFKNGKVLIGPTVSVAPVRLHVSGTNLGAIIGAVNNALLLSSSAGNGLDITAPNGSGIRSFSPSNIFRKIGTGLVPSPDPTSLIDVYTDDQGVRIIPRIDEAARDAISNPAPQLEIVNTTRNRKEIFADFWGWKPVGEIATDWGYRFQTEFIIKNGGLLPMLGPAGSTTGSMFVAGRTTMFTSLNSDSTISTSWAALNSDFTIYGADTKRQFKTSVFIDEAIGTGGIDYYCYFGIVDEFQIGDMAEGIYFLYDVNGVAPSAGSPNWQCVVVNTTGGTVIVDSGIGVANDVVTDLEWRQNGTEIYFFIGNTQVATITDYAPNGANRISATLFKIGGIGSRRIGIDYIDFTEKFNTPRGLM